MKNEDFNISADELYNIIEAIDRSTVPETIDADHKIILFDTIDKNVQPLSEVSLSLLDAKKESVFFMDNMIKIMHSESPDGSICETIAFKGDSIIMSRVSLPLPITLTPRLRRCLVGLLQTADQCTFAFPDECDNELLISAQIIDAVRIKEDNGESC